MERRRSPPRPRGERHPRPTNRPTFACTQVNGLPGAEYGGDASFILWVYPTEQAAADEWALTGNWTVHPVFACNRPPANLYHQGNLVMWASIDPPTSQVTMHAAGVLAGLPNRGPVPAGNAFPLEPPAPGSPLGAAALLDALSDLGLSYFPYYQIVCPYGESAAAGQWALGPLPGQGPGQGPEDVSFLILVFPSVGALELEWEIGVDGVLGQVGVHQSRYPDCRGGGEVYRNSNILLMPLGDVWNEAPEFKASVINAFLELHP